MKKSKLLILFVLSLLAGAITAAAYRAMLPEPHPQPAPPEVDGDGPPPGYPAADVDAEATADGLVETPAGSWWLDDPGPQPDTPSYIFDEPMGPDHPWGGEQQFGTMDKYGVSRHVVDALPDRAADFEHIGKAHAARITWMADNGYDMPDGCTWRVEICTLANVDGEQRLAVIASYGNDDMAVTFGPSEIWRLEDGGADPTLLSQSRFLPLDFGDQPQP